MGSYRLGMITVEDEEVGTLDLEGDGFAAAGELSTLLTNFTIHRLFGLNKAEISAAGTLVDEYRAALRMVYGDGHWIPPSLDPRTSAARAQLAADAEQLLGKDRFARLQRLSWRILDGSALADDEVAGLLTLSPSQRAEILSMAALAEAENQQVLRSVSHLRQPRLATDRPIADAGRAAAKDSDARLRDVLTLEQRRQFDQIKAVQ